MSFQRFLAAGAVVSLVLHGTGSAFFAQAPSEVSVAASEGGSVAVIGSIEELVAGARTDAVPERTPVEKVEPDMEPLEPVREPLKRTKPAPDTPVKPVEAVPVQAVTEPVPVATAPSSAIVPLVDGVTRTDPVTAVEPSKTESRQVPPPDRKIAPVKPVAAKPTELQAVRQPVEIARTDPAMTAQPVTRELAPLQPIEASLTAVAKTPRTKPRPQVHRVEPKTTPDRKVATARNKGANTSSRKGGEKVTSRTARSNANGRKEARSRDGGTRAASNYKGKVVAKLRRAKRYPSKARRRSLAGTAHVAFTISRSGAVSAIRLTRSSGHALLDQAALDMVRRAAPMPEFPRDITVARMNLQVPVRFDR